MVYGIRAFSYLLPAATFSAIPQCFFSLPASCACQGKRHLNSISRVSAPHLEISLPAWLPSTGSIREVTDNTHLPRQTLFAPCQSGVFAFTLFFFPSFARPFALHLSGVVPRGIKYFPNTSGRPKVEIPVVVYL